MMKEATSADVLSLHSRGEEATDLENNQGDEEVLKPCVRNNRLKIQQSYHFTEFSGVCNLPEVHQDKHWINAIREFVASFVFMRCAENAFIVFSNCSPFGLKLSDKTNIDRE